MKRYIVAIALLFAIAVPAGAARVVTISIEGLDAACDSFAPIVSGTNVVLTCVPSAPGAPTGCAATLNGQLSTLTLPSTGGQATLAVTCASPASGLTYNWSKNGTAGANTASSWTENFGPNTSRTTDRTTGYQAEVCAGSACVTVPATPLSVTVSHAPGGTN